LRIHSRLPHRALNGSNGWIHKLEARPTVAEYLPTILAKPGAFA
jgi:hypothetical protein